MGPAMGVVSRYFPSRDTFAHGTTWRMWSTPLLAAASSGSTRSSSIAAGRGVGVAMGASVGEGNAATRVDTGCAVAIDASLPGSKDERSSPWDVAIRARSVGASLEVRIARRARRQGG